MGYLMSSRATASGIIAPRSLLVAWAGAVTATVLLATLFVPSGVEKMVMYMSPSLVTLSTFQPSFTLSPRERWTARGSANSPSLKDPSAPPLYVGSSGSKNIFFSLASSTWRSSPPSRMDGVLPSSVSSRKIL